MQATTTASAERRPCASAAPVEWILRPGAVGGPQAVSDAGLPGLRDEPGDEGGVVSSRCGTEGGGPSERLSLRDVNSLDEREFLVVFGSILEHSPWVAAGAWRERPFDGFSRLHNAFVKAMHEAPHERRLALIRAHPDLAGKAAISGDLTPESSREQSSAGLDDLTPEQYEAFTRINREYRERFGFPLVVAVRGHTKETILSEAANRLERSRPEEVEAALAEISKIAFLRLRDRVEPEARETARDEGA